MMRRLRHPSLPSSDDSRMFSMPPVGLRFSPPESNVMPLPTSAMTSSGCSGSPR